MHEFTSDVLLHLQSRYIFLCQSALLFTVIIQKTVTCLFDSFSSVIFSNPSFVRSLELFLFKLYVEVSGGLDSC